MKLQCRKKISFDHVANPQIGQNVKRRLNICVPWLQIDVSLPKSLFFVWTTFISPKYKAQKKDWRQEWLYIIENSTGYSYQKENLAIVLHPSGMRYTVWIVNKMQNKTAKTKSNQIKSNSVNKLSTQHSSALEMGSPMGSPLLLQPMSFPQHFPMRKFSQSSSPIGLCKRKKKHCQLLTFPQMLQNE